MTIARLILFCLCVVLPVAVWPGSTTYESVKFAAWSVGGAALLAAAAWSIGRGAALRLPPRPALAAALLLLAAILVSFLGAPSRVLPSRTLALAALWLVTAEAARAVSISRRDLRLLVSAAVIGGTVTSVLALAQMGGLLPGAPTWTGQLSGIGTLGNENYVAGLAAVLLLPSLMVLGGSTGWWRAAAWASAPALAAMVLFAEATGPKLAVAAAGLATFAVWSSLRLAGPRRAALVLTALIAAGGAGGVWLVKSGLQASGDSAGGAAPRRLLDANHGDERRVDWLAAVQQFSTAPVTGVGAGNFGTFWAPAVAALQNDPDAAGLPAYLRFGRRTHNEYLQALAELGLAGMALLAGALAAYAVAWRRAWLAAPDAGARRDQLLATGGLLTVGVHALVSFPLHLPATALVAAVMAGAAVSPAAGGEHPPAARLGRAWSAIPAALALAVLVLTLRGFGGDLQLAQGRALHVAGDADAAATALSRGTQRVIWPGEGLVYLGLSQAAIGAPAAEATLRRSLHHHATFEALLALADLHLETDRHAEADSLARLVIAARAPFEAQQHAAYIRGTSLMRRGDLRAARDVLNTALALDRQDHRLLLAQGTVYLKAGDPRAAQKHYIWADIAIQEKLKGLETSDDPAAAGQIARLEHDRGVVRKAIEALDRN